MKWAGGSAGVWYLVEKVLDEGGDADVVEVSVDQQQLGEKFEPCDGVVTVPHGLPALLPHDACKQPTLSDPSITAAAH